MRGVFLRVFAALVVVGLTILWFVLPTQRPGGGAAAPAPSFPGAATPAHSETLRTGAQELASGVPRAEAEPVATAPAADPTSAVPAVPLVVQVRSGDGGMPLEGATVRWATLQRMREAREAQPGARNADVEKLLERVGTATLSDANGEARVPRLGERLRVSARHGELFTYAMLRGDETEPVPLELDQDRSVEILVVDGAGRAREGVPVAVSVALPRGDDERWRGETREDGIAELAHAQVELAGVFQRGTVFAELVLPMAVDADDPLVVPRVAFDDQPWPSRPLRLVLPPTGGVTVRLLAESGEPYVQRARVELSLVDRNPDMTARQRNSRTFSREAEQGVASFSYVGVDLELRVNARSFDELRPVTDTVTGPLRAGQVVEVPLRFEQRWPVLVGRLLDEGGMPLAERSVEVRLQSGGNERGTHEFVSDSEGRFRCTIESRGVLRELTLELLAAKDDADVARTKALELATLPPEDVDLGDVVLEPAGLIAAGIVLDAADEPVEGAGVQAQFGLTDGRGRMRWDSARSALGATSGADGRFELRGITQPEELRLVASKRGWTDAGPVASRLGAEDVVLRLSRSGALEGALLLNPGVEPGLFQVRASWSQVDAYGGDLRRNASTRVEGSGRFVIDNVAPGRVGVEIALAGTGRRFDLIEGLLVTSGETMRDPRLNPVDLSDDVFAYEIAVLDGARRPVESGFVATTERSNRNTRMAYAIRGGVASVLAFARQVDLEISAPGHSTLFVQGVDGDREVVLDPAFSVRLHLAEHVRLPRSPVVLQAKLLAATGGRRQSDVFQIFDGGQAVGWSSPWTMGPENTFGPSREIAALVTRPGRQRLHLVLATRANGTERTQTVPPIAGLEIDVGPDDAGKEFMVAPSPGPYEQALRELDG
jgi:hypothetical protein